jgi:hypothetical protein
MQPHSRALTAMQACTRTGIFLDPLEPLTSTSVSGSTSGSASTSMSTPAQVGMWGAEVGSRLETLNEMEG